MSNHPPQTHPGLDRPSHAAGRHGGTRSPFAHAHPAPARPRRKRLWTQVHAVSRAVHIYLTMLGLLVMLLFGVTGFTINHEAWFGATEPRLIEVSGTIPTAPLSAGDRLGVVEALRASFNITGAVTAYDDWDGEIAVAFKEPGQIWETLVNAETGSVEVRHELFNFAAIVNNLHRGRYTGEAWRWVIDLSSLLIFLACVTGFILWMALPKRRRLGVAFLAAGTILTMAVIYWFVPGADQNVLPRVTAEAILQ
jgi:hypothetical protein